MFEQSAKRPEPQGKKASPTESLRADWVGAYGLGEPDRR